MKWRKIECMFAYVCVCMYVYVYVRGGEEKKGGGTV